MKVSTGRESELPARQPRPGKTGRMTGMSPVSPARPCPTLHEPRDCQFPVTFKVAATCFGCNWQ